MRLDTGQSSHPPAKKQKIVEKSEKVHSRAAKSKKQSDKLSKDKNLTDSSIDHSEARVSLDKDKVVPNVEMRDADKAPAASEEQLSLSKSDLDEIKSYVRTYVDMKFNDLQKLMVDQYTGLLEVVKEGFASFGNVSQYPMHESEKGNPNIEVDPPQSVNKHTTDAKSYNIVDVAGQSCKLGINEGAIEESLKKAESSYADKLQEVDRHSTDVEVDEAIMKERVMESEEALQNTDEDLSKAITLKGKDEYYTAKHADLKPTLDFVVAHPVKKHWFYDMAKSSNCWNDKIDLSSHVENIRSIKVASIEKSICEIMQGLCILAGISWHLIDKVYVPINYKGSFHWVLTVIVLKERCILVYDSMKGHRGHTDKIKELAEMLSTYLTISDFFEKKDRTDWSLLDAYKDKTDQHAFDVHIIDGIVQ
ncbi:hypothetical protein BC332_16355 [Capsicum chinense]|nr:hypothetical protein BC332_16355 [Capsicum chinense]